jgi:hypothetical protein
MPSRRWLRGMFAALAALAVWLVARPSFAASYDAPLCDDRGATVIAPPPTLVPVRTFFDVAAADSSCPDRDGDKLALRGADGQDAPSRGPAASAHADVEAILPRGLSLADAVRVYVAAARAARVALPLGVSVRVERPPRA